MNMTQSVRFYTDVLGMEPLYGGEGMGFSSLRARNEQSAILNQEQAEAVTQWAAYLLRHGCGCFLESSTGTGI